MGTGQAVGFFINAPLLSPQKILDMSTERDKLMETNTILRAQVVPTWPLLWLKAERCFAWPLTASLLPPPSSFHFPFMEQLEQLEEQLQHDQRDEIERLTGEFSKRMGTLEVKFREASKERDSLRLQLEEVRGDGSFPCSLFPVFERALCPGLPPTSAMLSKRHAPSPKTAAQDCFSALFDKQRCRLPAAQRGASGAD